MASFNIEKDYRTDEEREKDRLRKTKKNSSMDILEPEQPSGQPKNQLNMSAIARLQGIEMESADRFDIARLFDAVASGDITKLEGLEEYLNDSSKTLASTDYQDEGKTALMKALLHLKNGDNKTVKYLLDIAEKKNDLYKFVNVARTNKSYKGQTALHIAIERRNKHFAQMLIQKGADVHARACGTFFQPLGETCFYFGELPLSLAACTNQKDIVDLLMEKADVRRTDTLGNTVLHALVMVADNSLENTDFIVSMYDYILTKDAAKNPEKKLEDIKNNQGLTSIKLAAKLGKIGLLQHILQREFHQEECRHLSRKFTEWEYGPVSGLLYDLEAVDSYEPNSVLGIVVYGTEIPNRLEMLQIEPLNELLEDKWNRFGKWIFHIKFIFYFLYLIIFTAVSYHHKKVSSLQLMTENLEGRFLLLAGVVTMAVGSLYFFSVVLKDLKKKRPSLKKLLVDGYSDLLFLLQAALFLICVVLYVFGKQLYLSFLVVSLAMCWVNLLYFSRGSQTMGIYNIMIQRIFLGDIMRFLLVYIVFLIGFSAAIVTLLNHPKEGWSLDTIFTNGTESCGNHNFNTLSCTILELFKFTIGIGDLEFTEHYENIHVFYVLLLSYIVLTYILLLNMLIALMSKNVDDMSEKSTSIWKLQRAITILDLESDACCLKKMLRSGVNRKLGNNEEDWRWCLSVKEVNWKNCKRKVNIINEDPGCKPATDSYKESTQRAVSRQISEQPAVRAEEEEPMFSSAV